MNPPNPNKRNARKRITQPKKNNNNAQNPPGRRTRRRRKNGPQTAPGFGVFLSGCARDYIRCLADASPSGPLACVPSIYPNFSFQQRCFTKGTWTLGPSFTGFIVCDPRHASTFGIAGVLTNSPTFALPSIDLNTASESIQYTSNSNFTYLDLGPAADNYAMRVVSVLLRIRYTGTLLNTSGTAICLHDPTHSSFQLRSASDIDADVMSQRLHISDKWINIHYRPVETSDYIFYEGPFPSSSRPPAGAVNGGIQQGSSFWYMGAWIQCSIASSFEFECWSVCEFQGRNVRGQKIAHADAVGLSAASTAAVGLKPNQATPTKVQEGMLQKATHILANGTSYVKQAKNVFNEGVKFSETFFSEFAPLFEAFA